MHAENVEDVYGLSPAQEGILFETLYSQDAGTYLVQSTLQLSGALDIAAFKTAWNLVMQRNAALRTCFYWEKLERPLQVVFRNVEPCWEEQDWRTIPAQQQQIRLEEHLQGDRARGFDLTRAPLLRFTLFQTEDQRYEFLISSHHLILDGWSKSLMIEEAFSAYEALSNGMVPQPPKRPPFRGFLSWLERQDLQAAERYWRAALRGLAQPTALPDFPAEAAVRSREQYAEENLRISQTQSSRWLESTRAQSCTLGTLMLAAWGLLLSRYTDERKVMFGSTVSGRPDNLPGFEKMVGLFITSIPTVVEMRSHECAGELLRRLQLEHLTAREHGYAPLSHVQEWSEVPRGTPLFETLLVFENYPLTRRKDFAGVTASRGLSVERATFPLSILISPLQQIHIRAIYDTSRFAGPAVTRILLHYCNLIDALSADPKQPADLLSALSDSERQQLLAQWNATALPCPKVCVHELFSDIARQFPSAAAVLCEGEELSYKELDHRSTQLAHFLRGKGIGLEERIGLCLERSLELIIAILGIWKAGAALVPLDPSYPSARLEYMLADSGASVLLTHSQLGHKIQSRDAELLCLDEIEEQLRREAAPAFECPSVQSNLAYVLYTSGSTGVPKGVEVEHHGLVNVAVAQRGFGLTRGDRMLQFASLSFDASIFEICMALTSGAALVMLPEDKALFSARLFEFISNGKITAATLPPSVAATLPEEDARALRVLTVAGEPCPPDLVRRWARGRRFWNLYGPTEYTIWATSVECSEQTGAVPIGRPIANTKTYVLNQDLEPAPIGAPGNLYVCGLGLARGYHGKAALTAERFIPDPFSAISGSRMYKTGDRARWWSNGELEFLGRADHQVKLRGFRIELGEIESTLGRHPAVGEAVVTLRNDRGNPQIVAYWKASSGSVSGGSELRVWLSQQLPSHMVPAAFVPVADWPLTVNGKIDRAALPAPEQASLAETQPMLQPETDLERTLAQVWQKVLGVSRVGVQENFFDMGGNSLLLMRLYSLLRPMYGSRISIIDLFAFPSIRTLAAHLNRGESAAAMEGARERGAGRRAYLTRRDQHRAKGQAR